MFYTVFKSTQNFLEKMLRSGLRTIQNQNVKNLRPRTYDLINMKIINQIIYINSPQTTSSVLDS